MHKRGFTLVELLAVMVVLGIIVTIGTPVVLHVIDSAKAASNKRSIEYYGSTIDNYISDYMSQNNGVMPTWDNIEKNITKYYKNKVTCDIHMINKDATVYLDECTVGKKLVENFTYGHLKGNFPNGTIVYFDVATGQKCSKEIYEKSYDSISDDYQNSFFEYNGIEDRDTTYSDGNYNSCLKFYTFNDDGYESPTIDMILDHNTVGSVRWSSTDSNVNGPDQALAELLASTSEWNGTEKPDDYYVSQLGGGNYIIDYKAYKARLMTLEDIEKIINTKIDSQKLIEDNAPFIIDNNFREYYNELFTKINNGEIEPRQAQEQLMSQASKLKLKNTWLYDRIDNSCEIFQCPNMSEDAYQEYYLSTSIPGQSGYSLLIASGVLHYNPIGGEMHDTAGIRPVIKVLKSKLE